MGKLKYYNPTIYILAYNITLKRLRTMKNWLSNRTKQGHWRRKKSRESAIVSFTVKLLVTDWYFSLPDCARKNGHNHLNLITYRVNYNSRFLWILAFPEKYHKTSYWQNLICAKYDGTNLKNENRWEKEITMIFRIFHYMYFFSLINKRKITY